MGIEKFLLALHLSIFTTFIITINLGSFGARNYYLLARSFVRGKTYFIDQLPNKIDVVYWHGKNYWPLGPLPSVILIPFSLGSVIIPAQQYLQLVTLVGVIFLVYRLTIDYRFSRLDTWWLIAAFFLGSIFFQVSIRPTDWYLAHTIAVFFGLLGIIMTLKKQWLLAGISIGLASLSRELMVISVIFPLLMTLENFRKWKKWLFNAALVSIPVLICAGTTIFYSYIRFGTTNPTHQHILANLDLVNQEERNQLFNKGVFSVKYLPGNFYYYFFKTFDLVTDPVNRVITQAKHPYIQLGYPGTSFFVASPIFIYIFSLRRLQKRSIAAIATIIPMTIILLLLYWPGFNQIGPRYLNDAFPFIFLLLLEAFKNQKLPLVAKISIFTSSWVNLYLLLNLWT